jgi:hypothetical protein
MANVIYPKWKERLMSGASGATLDSAVRAVLIDTNVYTYSESHTFVSDLTGIVGNQSDPFTNKTFLNGIFDADNISFAGVTGNTAEALVIFLGSTASPSSSRIVAYLDTGFTGLPITPNGNDIPVVWPPGGIFKL